MNFFHRLFNPHCAHCEELDRENKVNQTVEILKSEIATLRYEKEQMLKTILEMANPAPVIQHVEREETPKPVNTGMAWRWRKQELERADRKEAEIRRAKLKEEAESNKSTEQLEKELALGDDDAGKVSEAV